MFKSYKYRLYPTDSQKELIAKHIGSVRFVYNLALETKNRAYLDSNHILSSFELMKQLTEVKKECEWLKDVNTQSLQQSIQHMDSAFKHFFKGAGFPKYKKKSNSGSFSVPQRVNIKDNFLFIPKFREGINIVLHRPIRGCIRQATISRTLTGKYFVSILVDTDTEIPSKEPVTEGTTIGIDLGIKDFAITSNGDVFENPKYLRKAQSKLKYVQRKYSKYKGKRTKQKLALLHEKVVNKRKDFLHKVSTKLIRENQTIALETLGIKEMLQNKQLSQLISDVGWGMFVEMLKYKAEWYGVNILQIGRYEPSSKTCSNCGSIKEDLKLSDRVWECKKCSTNHNRDLNAALNIKNIALNNYVCGTHTKIHSELPTLVGVMTYETPHHKTSEGVVH